MMNKIINIILICILFFGINSCGIIIRGTEDVYHAAKKLVTKRRSGDLTKQEFIWAQVAWKYFDNNYNMKTGLVNSREKYHGVTVLSIAENLIATCAAYKLKVIDKYKFDDRVTGQLAFLNRMQLFDKRLPNRLYNAKNGKMSKYNLKYGSLGWDANHIGRLLIALKILRQKFPHYGEYIDRILMRWDFCPILDSNGTYYSSLVNKKGIYIFPDGYLGSKQYFARGFQAWGYITEESSKFKSDKSIRMYDIDLLYDPKLDRLRNQNIGITSSEYLLDGLEFDWDNNGSTHDFDYISISNAYEMQAENMFKVQRKRYCEHKIFTARSPHRSLGKPYYLFDAIFSNGYEWNTTDRNGKLYAHRALVSTSAAFGFWVLWDCDYTDKLMHMMNTCYNPRLGWYEGREEKTGKYEKAITSETNAMVLEALWFKQEGQLYEPIDFRYTYYYHYLYKELEYRCKCYPKNRIIIYGKFDGKYYCD